MPACHVPSLPPVNCFTGDAASLGCVEGATVFPDLLCNAAGCFAMGALQVQGATSKVDARPDQAESDWHSTHPGLSSGLRTGFCGSLTTFSSW